MIRGPEIIWDSPLLMYIYVFLNITRCLAARGFMIILSSNSTNGGDRAPVVLDRQRRARIR